MEYRPLPSDRAEEFREYVDYAFSPEDGPGIDDEVALDDQPGDERALLADGELLAVCRHYWFRARLRDRWFELPGLSAVASPPEHRRQGNVARMLAESLVEYRDRGDPLTALWAFEHSFYARQGWGLATKFAEYECDPETLGFARDRVDESGRFRRLDADDYHLLDPVLAAANEGRELALDRTEQWWRKRIFEGWQGDPYVYGWADDAGELRGYVAYRVEDEDGGKRLAADEFVAADHEARLHCLRLLADHDSQVDRVSFYGTPDADLFDVVDDPGDVECEVKPGPMARIVDVPAAFEAFAEPAPDAPEGAATEFTLSVSDPLADWNDGTFRVALADGTATCEPTDAPDDEADATTGVGALSQVVAGYHSVADAERFGDLEIRTPAVRDALAAAFPEREVFLTEGF
ncbi:GNAT family N-acetyltransferase [Halorussus halobius]|uniref:GNAT family N-acetyltransferase n=1 Tax=Halorussus halobius TaxID=1710537 RepID=UPI00109205EF|nr:GNAT family N-acetyltransferase [Halorussus halobius]